MLHLILYKHSKDIDQAQFLKFASQDHSSLLIAPNPQIADYYRSKNPKLKVLTIASYLGQAIADFYPEASHKFKNKAEILTALAASFKRKYSGLSYVEFEYSYNILSDLRSYTLSDDTILSVLEEYPKKISDQVLFLSQMFNALEIYDEHQAYFELSEKIRSKSSEEGFEGTNIIFSGFQFFTGMQIDYLKALGLYHDVYIPLAEEIYKEAKPTDWPSWIQDARLEVTQLDSDLKIAQEMNVDITLFNTGEFNQVLKSLDKENAFNNQEILLLDNKVNYKILQEITLKNIGFKINYEMFEHSIEKIYVQISNWVIDSENEIFIKDVLRFVEDLINQNKLKENYVDLKTLLSFRHIVMTWQEWHEDTVVVDKFDLNHFYNQVILAQTRNSLFSPGKQILGRDSLLMANFSNTITAIMTKNYQGLKSSKEKYSSSVEKLIAPIGPIRRGAFDFLFYKTSILELIQTGKISFLLDFDSYENDIGLKEIFSVCSLNIKEKIMPTSYLPKRDVIKLDSFKTKTIDRFSATSLQAYIDCPRKFQINYLKKIKPDIRIDSIMQKFELGRIEHEIIEKYFDQYKNWDEKGFNFLAEQSIDLYLSKEEKKLSSLDKKIIRTEILTFSRNGILELLKLPFINKKFEDNISQYDPNFSGRIDFWGIAKETLFIIDFKRSSGSIPSKIQMLNFEKIQLSFYLARLINTTEYKNIVFGYLNLNEPDKSLFLTMNDSAKDIFKEFDYLNGCSPAVIKDADQFIMDYLAFEKKLINEIRNDKIYQPIIKDESVCSYCPISAICPKEPLESMR